MLPRTGTWTLNEAILGTGGATADNLAPRFAQLQYSWRSPRLDMQERIAAVLDQNAEHVAAVTHCRVRRGWVTKTRVGLPNHAMAGLVYANLKEAGPPAFDDEAVRFAREIQRGLGLEAMDAPFLENVTQLSTPQETETVLRENLPPWQLNYTSDDYVEYTWHAPTCRLLVGRAQLRSPSRGYRYPHWAWCAMGGFAATIDPTILTAARTIGASIVELMLDAAALAHARREFEERTGGGIGGAGWIAPLLPRDFEPPINYWWPEYVETPRGSEWMTPIGA
jgi:aminobenzoyl-glutamate utilization protein B